MLAKSADSRFKDASALVAALDALGELGLMAKTPPSAAGGDRSPIKRSMAGLRSY
jgi:hypothetical protein